MCSYHDITNNNPVVKSMSGVVGPYAGGSCGGYGGGVQAAAFVLVLFILLVIILRAGF